MNINKYLIFVVCSFFILSKVQAENLKNIELPMFDIMTGMKTVWVAKKMIYNGQPMSIQKYKSNRQAKDVMRFFESKWKIKGLGELKYQKVGKELTIGFVDKGYSYSVQASDIPGGSAGTLVVTRNKIFMQAKLTFPLSPNAHIVSRIHNLDMGIKSETITVSNYHSVLMNKQWYESTLTRAGWIGQTTMGGRKENTLEYQRGKELCQLTFIGRSPVREHRSMVMIHWIKG